MNVAMSLVRAGARGGSASILSRLAIVLARLLSTILLARLLSPDDFGVFAVLAALVELSVAIIEFGLPLASTQRSNMSQSARSSLFVINAGLGVVVGAAFVVCAPLLASAYEAPEMAVLTYWVAAVPILTGISAQFRAEMMSSLRFVSLSAIQMVSRVSSIVIAVAYAFMYQDVFALVLLTLLPAVFELPAFAIGSHWRPGVPGAWRETREVLVIGSRIFGLNLVRSASRSIIVPIAGLAVPSTALGYYDRANQLSAAPTNALTDALQQVAVPTLGRARATGDDLPRYFDRLQSLLTFTFVTALGVAAAVGEPLIVWLLGEDWSAAGLLFQLTTVAVAFRFMTQVQQWYFISSERTAIGLRLTLWSQPLVVLISLLGLFWGITGLAAMNAFSMIALWPISAIVAARSTGLPTAALLTGPTKVLLTLSVPSALAAFLGTLVFAEPAVQLLGAGTAALLVSLLCFLMSRGLRDEFRTLFRLLKLVLRQKDR